MRGFETNNCRLCDKVFCCEKCRIKHEVGFHRVFPKCDICVYGRFVFENVDEAYLDHLKSTHLPLHCVYCKKIFNTIEEIIQHKKCLVPKEDSPKTPFKQVTPIVLLPDNDQDSPILQEQQRKEVLNYIFNLATSTPMQSGQEANLMFDKSKEAITPVDKPPQIINKSIIKKSDSMKSDNSKRRVTFGEIRENQNIVPDAEDNEVNSPKPTNKAANDKLNCYLTPITTLNTTSQFYSAKTDLDQYTTAKTSQDLEKDVEQNSLQSIRFTPVSTPKSKLNTIKSDIYKKNYTDRLSNSLDQQKSSNNESDKVTVKNDSNNERVSTEMGTPDQKSDTNTTTENSTTDSNLLEVSMEICTPDSKNKSEYAKISNENEYINLAKLTMKKCTTGTALNTSNQSYNLKKGLDTHANKSQEVPAKIEKNSSESIGCTPVSVSSKSKLNTLKGDIYKKDNTEPTNSQDDKGSSNKPDINKESMDIGTPEEKSNRGGGAKIKNNPEDSDLREDSLGMSTPNQKSEHSIRVTNENQDSNLIELSMELCTPAKPDNSKKAIDICSNKINNFEDQTTNNITETSCEIIETADDATSKTLWLSALNLNHTHEQDDDKCNEVNDEIEHKKSESSPSSDLPSATSKRRVSIVLPTPILKRTDVQMKFHLPGHYSSTPIMSSSTVKMKQTKIVEEISSRVLKQQTPFKTPKGKLSEFAGRSLLPSNIAIHFEDIGEGPSNKELVPLSETSKNYSTNENHPCTDLTEYYSNDENNANGLSVSSMTESSLWTSMTRIVKSMLGGLNLNQEATNSPISKNSTSFKRQLPEPDMSDDFLEAPRLKRFKFTDIKCRRPIRNLPALEAPTRLSRIPGPVATLEIVKSVSTLYGSQRIRIQCDKATQTDDYLMFGWHPNI